MVLLHVVATNNDPTSGVDVAVSQHIKAQSAIAQVAVVNVYNMPIDTAPIQFEYRSDFSLDQLDEPFSKPDLVVFHNIYYLGFIKISKILEKKRIPYIIIPHGALSATAQRKRWLKKTAANLLCFSDFFKRAVAIQFLSAHEKEVSKYREKGFLGTNGVAMPLQKKQYIKRDQINMVYIGRMEVHVKGLDLLIEAIEKSRDLFRQHHIHLDLYGPDHQGGDEIIRNLMADHNVLDLVTLHDTVLGEEKERILLDSDLFIQASRSEGMPMGVLETLSYGIPCIVTEGTNLANIIHKYDAGWTSETTVNGITQAIEAAIQDRHLWDEKSEHARKLVCENYVLDNVAADTVKEYEKIVRKLRESCF